MPDQYAFDFDVPVGTPFMAARAGTVFRVVEDAPSDGGGAGNYVVIDHGDGTYGLYYHSPMNGISVGVGSQVDQGDVLGETGRSGLAGYPHLHFTVVVGAPDFPYDGIPVSFRNVSPPHVNLNSHSTYTAQNY
jgi:murein DD-endopeptidase MepM/ murein hydrolase activator NlpD